MKRLTKWLAAVAVVAGVGVGTQTANAGDPVRVFRTFPPHRPAPVFPRPPIVVAPKPPIIVAPPVVVRPPVVVTPPIFVPPPRIDFDYVVLYKPSIFSPVVTFGRYETLFRAQNAARQLEFSGYATRIERFRDTGWYGW